MGKYVNPKTLKGQDKLNRMLDLMGKMTTLNESKSFSELELIKRGPNGIVYGIIRENHDYFIKTSNKKSGKFLAENFSYIGGLQNKYDERYHSYSEALKQLNLKFDMLNESYGIKRNTNIFESDGRAIAGGAGFGFVLEDEDDDKEEIISDEKKVLKVDSPKSSSDEPVEDEVSDDPEVDMGGDIADVDFGDEESDDLDTGEEDLDTGEEGGEGKDETTKKIQKLTGKIGQLLRDKEDVDSELEKYVINSIISALHLDEMDESDKEDIISKIEGEEEEGEEDLDTEEGDDLDTGEEETPEPGSEELSENYKRYKKSVSRNTNKSKIYSKRQLMESFLSNQTKKSLKKVLKENRSICEECMGAGCRSCTNEHHNMTHTNYGKFDRNEYMIKEDNGMCNECGGLMREGMCMECGLNESQMMYEKLKGNQKKLDVAKPYGKLTSKDFEQLRRGKRSEGRRDRRRGLMGEDDMTMMDAVRTGQGYLPTGDLDRDFDGVSNRLDMDNNSDGRLDFSDNSNRYGNQRGKDDFIELDIDFLRSNAPVKQPGIDTPITKPHREKKPWETIKRPQVDPRPKANSPVTKPEIDTPITKPDEDNKWKKIKRPQVDPRPKALGDEKIKPSFRRRGMFR